VIAAQEVTRGVCSIHFERVRVAAIRRRETDIVEHGACVEKLCVELEPTALSREYAKIIDAE
jgi:hypothetical protein